MKLGSFLFGGKRHNSVAAMNKIRENQSREQIREETRQENERMREGGSCNPPPRQSGEGDFCSPYGKLLPDAEKYSKKIIDRGNDPIIFSPAKEARNYDNYRTALWTGENMQIVTMALDAGEEIPTELHEDTDQMIGVTDGKAEILIGRYPDRLTSLGSMRGGEWAIVPAGFYHKVKNSSPAPLRLITVYAPPHHPYGTVQKNSEEK